MKDTTINIDDAIQTINKQNKRIEELCLEIERLNNIIDELEKYISQEWYCFDNESVEFAVAKEVLNKLKELKEGNKDE